MGDFQWTVQNLWTSVVLNLLAQPDVDLDTAIASADKVVAAFKKVSADA